MRLSCDHWSTDWGVPSFQDKVFATLSKTVPFKLLSPIMKIACYIKGTLNSHNSKQTLRKKSENKGKAIK